VKSFRGNARCCVSLGGMGHLSFSPLAAPTTPPLNPHAFHCVCHFRRVAYVFTREEAHSCLCRVRLRAAELCRSFTASGSCRYAEKCQFAHGHAELRPAPRHPKYKTERCKTFWSKGSCPYRHRCRFLHDEEVAYTPQQGLTAMRPANVQVVYHTQGGPVAMGSRTRYLATNPPAPSYTQHMPMRSGGPMQAPGAGVPVELSTRSLPPRHAGPTRVDSSGMLAARRAAVAAGASGAGAGASGAGMPQGLIQGMHGLSLHPASPSSVLSVSPHVSPGGSVLSAMSGASGQFSVGSSIRSTLQSPAHSIGVASMSPASIPSPGMYLNQHAQPAPPSPHAHPHQQQQQQQHQQQQHTPTHAATPSGRVFTFPPVGEDAAAAAPKPRFGRRSNIMHPGQAAVSPHGAPITPISPLSPHAFNPAGAVSPLRALVASHGHVNVGHGRSRSMHQPQPSISLAPPPHIQRPSRASYHRSAQAQAQAHAQAQAQAQAEAQARAQAQAQAQAQARAQVQVQVQAASTAGATAHHRVASHDTSDALDRQLLTARLAAMASTAPPPGLGFSPPSSRRASSRAVEQPSLSTTLGGASSGAGVGAAGSASDLRHTVHRSSVLARSSVVETEEAGTNPESPLFSGGRMVVGFGGSTSSTPSRRLSEAASVNDVAPSLASSRSMSRNSSVSSGRGFLPSSLLSIVNSPGDSSCGSVGTTSTTSTSASGASAVSVTGVSAVVSAARAAAHSPPITMRPVHPPSSGASAGAGRPRSGRRGRSPRQSIAALRVKRDSASSVRSSDSLSPEELRIAVQVGAPLPADVSPGTASRLRFFEEMCGAESPGVAAAASHGAGVGTVQSS